MDDITFCLSDCLRTDCYRHPGNIQDRTIPHSYADFKGTETCPVQTNLQPTCNKLATDCIDRLAAIDALKQIGSIDTNADREYAEKVFMALPSAQRWIPVTEALPDEDGYYLVTGKRESVYITGYSNGRWYGGAKPIAWLPRPEPWRGGQE